MLAEIMDKSAFYGFNREEEKTQGIAYLLIEMFKIRRSINALSMHPQMADEFYNEKWDTELSKRYANSKVLESRKCLRNFQFWNAKIIIQSNC